MALEISVYNRQEKTSKSGKTYIGYVVAYQPGQRGAIPAAAELPPYYVRDQRGGTQWIRLEALTLTDAKKEAEKQQHVLRAVAKGVQVVSTPDENKQRLAYKSTAYLAEVEANKSLATWSAYNRSMELFLQSCKRLNVADVKREDLLAFKTFLKREELGQRTTYNHFLNVTIFLKWCAQNVGIKKNDWPAKPEREPEEYHADEIEKLLKAANKNERLLLNAFLNTGMRDGEISHLTYADIDHRNSMWMARPKNGHNLKTKESQRVIPVGEWLTRKVMERKAADNRKESDLIFPAPRGGVDEHLIRIVKRVAERAKVGGRVDDHKFRSTAITIWLRDGRTVPEVMAYVGHVNPETILRYAAKVNLSREENRKMVTKPFERFNGMGD
ncbi:MAG: site-specific integrase [Candidatus Acidiferrum sp.]